MHPESRGNSIAIREIDQRVRCLSPDRLLERFHELVDLRLKEPLKLMDALELKSIESRFDSEEQPELDRVSEYRAAWSRERSSLIASIERIITSLKSE